MFSDTHTHNTHTTCPQNCVSKSEDARVSPITWHRSGRAVSPPHAQTPNRGRQCTSLLGRNPFLPPPAARRVWFKGRRDSTRLSSPLRTPPKQRHRSKDRRREQHPPRKRLRSARVRTAPTPRRSPPGRASPPWRAGSGANTASSRGSGGPLEGQYQYSLEMECSGNQGGCLGRHRASCAWAPNPS